ncbi:DNA-directed RNA polymerase subunit beta [Lacticaseibacillus brantae]
MGIGLLSALILLILGLMIGYGVGGGNPFRVFLPSTWQHIFDFLK